ncbi:DUF2807 domain-containing protein [Candidatus Obscuribacterales bacterium]|nr:DUF2807 domain-containing protein [Candidatus Obscuribacterales bacterium]
MRNHLIISLLAVFALCGCDNPEDFSHPENPKKPGEITVKPTSPTPANDASQAPAPVTPLPEDSPGPRDTSGVKTGDAEISGEFDSVNSSASLETDITIGSPAKVTIEASEKSFNDIKLEVKDTTLNITTTPGFNATVAKVHITAPKITNITTSGAALVKLIGANGPTLNISANDNSSVDGYGAVDSINVTANGACCVRMKGLVAKIGNVTSNGKCAVEVKTTEEINATSSEGSVINVAGLPRKVNKHKTDRSFINLNNER